MAEQNVMGRETPVPIGADAQPVTVESMYHMPRDGRKYELFEGEVKMAPAGMYHEYIAGELYFRIRLYLQEHAIGSLYTSSAGYELPSGQVLSPDVSFASNGKFQNEKIPIGFGHFAPDLAVEVVSPGDLISDIEDKAQIYLENGTQLVWVIVPRSRRAFIYRTNRKLQVIEGDEQLDGEDVLPGFACPLSEIFGQ